LPTPQLLTFEQVKSMSRMWYGEPSMATAELSGPQSARVEMCPPQATTASSVVFVADSSKQYVIEVELFSE
jgi:hypothetical protein